MCSVVNGSDMNEGGNTIAEQVGGLLSFEVGKMYDVGQLVAERSGGEESVVEAELISKSDGPHGYLKFRTRNTNDTITVLANGPQSRMVREFFKE